jgi:cytochrome c biogenesis protein CcmG/thiol:disulfide interchange protein DsbE
VQIILVVSIIICLCVAAFSMDQFGSPEGRVISDQERLRPLEIETKSVSVQNIIDAQPIIKSVSFSTPIFRLNDLQSRSIDVLPLNRGITIYHFWASWCAPCIVELPDMLARAGREKDIRFILVSIDDDLKNITRFINRLERANQSLDIFPDNVLWLHDGEQYVANELFESFKVPESFIADDVTSMITSHVIGSADWNVIDLSQ